MGDGNQDATGVGHVDPGGDRVVGPPQGAGSLTDAESETANEALATGTAVRAATSPPHDGEAADDTAADDAAAEQVAAPPHDAADDAAEVSAADAAGDAPPADSGVDAAAADAPRVRTAARSGEPPTDPKERNLFELEALCADLERVITIAEVKLKTLEKRLASADNKYPKLLPLPGHGKKAASERFQEARRKLAIRIGELKEAEEWKRWANVPAQDALIKAVDELLEGEPTLALVDQLKRAQDEWKALGPAPQDKAQDLWARFKASTDRIYDKIKELRAAQNVELDANLERKKALCEQAEALAESNDWTGTAEALKRLQAEWKEIGTVPRKHAESIWRRFRAACDSFFERRRPHLERAIGEKQANLDRKRGVVERVEKLAAEAADLEDAAAQVADARREWKHIGQVPHREFAALSDRLNKASDLVFQRRDEARGARAAEARAAIEGPVVEAEAMLETAAGVEPVDGAELARRTVRARAALRELESRREGGHDVGAMRARVETLTRRAVETAPAAFKGTDLDPEQSRKRKEKLVAKIEGLAPPPAEPSAPGPLSAADIAAKLKAAFANRALGGVLSRQAKGRESKDVVAEARDSWSRLGPVPGAEGEELERRFTDACRRVGQ